MNWYVNNNGAAEGPFDEATMTGMARDQDLRSETLVWHPEMTDWVPVAELNPLWWVAAFQKKAPAPPPAPMPTAAGAMPAKKAPKPAAIPAAPAAQESVGLFRRLFGRGKKKDE
ncbi:MAG: DUF4339 domain-containing protein [Verrucomicrobiales bacterium]|nr:DUF4339 domain-containing protein [Verrucomicrobiales bacterium]MCP5559733.1 DUF4339 domain-containing protein [Verrucomicrobiaceae bacterium]